MKEWERARVEGVGLHFAAMDAIGVPGGSERARLQAKHSVKPEEGATDSMVCFGWLSVCRSACGI